MQAALVQQPQVAATDKTAKLSAASLARQVPTK
jgi:hypothetical protein